MITDAYDISTPALVSLQDFYGERRHICQTCLIILSHEIADDLLKRYSCAKVGEITAANGHIDLFVFEYNGKRLGFYLSPLGSTLCGQAMIEASWLLGASCFVMFGSCGSLDETKTRGRYVIPTEAYRDEGMSYHYAPASDYIRIRGCELTTSILDRMKIPYVKGRVWTTDAFLRETAGGVARRREEGCLAVEMELAGVQAVADFYGLQLYDFLEPGDVLGEMDYEAEELEAANHSLFKLQIAMELAFSLSYDVKLFSPHLEDLSYREKLVSDPATMDFNGGEDGVFPFDRDRWAVWYQKWGLDPHYHYWYIVNEEGDSCGEVTCTEYQDLARVRINMIVQAERRRMGIGGKAYRKMEEELKQMGYSCLEVEASRDTWQYDWLRRLGFTSVTGREDTLLMEKTVS